MNFRKSISVVLGIVTFSVSSFALTSGPSQPDFSCFEPVDASDLVNLPTGDFSYPIPLGDVKTPDGVGYPVVLSYHSGVMNEQEATWVGLGWTLNVGSINRQVRLIPDDYNSAATACVQKDPGESGWSFDIGGGWGPFSASVGFSGKAGGGVKFEGLTSVGVGWGVGVASVGVTLTPNAVSIGVGVGVGSVSVGGGVTIAGNGKVMGSFNAGISNVAGFSMASNGSVNVSVAGQSMPYHMAVNKAGFHQTSSNYHVTIPLPYGLRLDLGYGNWSWNYSFEQNEISFGYLNQVGGCLENCGDGIIEYGKSVNGSSNWQNPTSCAGAPKLEATKLGSYCFSAQDVYGVTGQGVSGQFMPFAYDPPIYCVSNDPQFDGTCGKVQHQEPWFWVAEGDPAWIPPDYIDVENFNQYCVSFRSTVSFNYKDGMAFKMLDESSLNLVDNMNAMATGTGTISYPGMNDYSNIGDAGGPNPVYTEGKRIIPIFGNFNQIAGFKIIDQQGKCYYYTCPIYNYYQTTYVNNTPTIPTFDSNFKGSFRRMTKPYASSWLLTAVTGPDYIKMVKMDEEPLLPQQGDWGYWVKFRYEYGLRVKDDVSTHMPKLDEGNTDAANGPDFIEKAAYEWRMPYFDKYTATPLPHNSDDCTKNQYSSIFGIRDVTYLKSIETASEVAFFRTSERLDGFGIDEWPALGHNFVAANISAPQNIDGGVDGSTNEFVSIAPLVANVNNNLSNCMIISLPKDNYPENSLKAQGREILQLTYNRQAVVYTQGIGVPCWVVDCSDRTEYLSANFDVIYDQYHCTLDQNGRPTVISGDCNPYMLTDMGGSSGYLAPGCATTPAGKCIYVTTSGNYTLLYVVAYSPSSERNLSTAVHFKPNLHRYGGRFWWLKSFHPATFYKINDLGTNVVPYVAQSDVDRYVKKLDEIAWYSKAKYPYLNGITDPEERYFKKNSQWNTDYPFPESYKRMKFRYNYELAKNTPNSKSDGVTGFEPYLVYKGGRLTLKEVYQQGGPEDAPVNMPSYLFSYQGVDNAYNGYKGSDPWGMQKPAVAGSTPVNQAGVNWNLSKILLPACGIMEINFERDRARSSWCTIKQLYDKYKCTDGKTLFEYPSITIQSLTTSYQSPGTPGGVTISNVKTYTNLMRISGYIAGSTTLQLDPTDPQAHATDLEKGMLLLVYFSGISNQGMSYYETHCLYRIVDIDPVFNSITIEKPLDLPSNYTPAISIKGIIKSSMSCDGIRVTKLQTRSLSGVYTTTYNYPVDGVIETIPEDVIPKLFKDTLVMKAYDGRGDRNISVGENGTSHSPGVFVNTGYYKEDPSDGQNHWYDYHFSGVYERIDAQGKYVQFTYVTSTPGQPAYFPADIYILYDNPDIQPNAVAVRHVTLSGATGSGNPMSWDINFPSTIGITNNIFKVGSALVSTAVPLAPGNLTINIAWSDNSENPSRGTAVRILGVNIHPIPNQTTKRVINPLYTTGNSTVTYPQIEVRQITPDNQQPNGFTRYSYYTFDDLVNVGGVYKPIMSSEIVNGTDVSTTPATNLKVWKITDRTSIVGLCKQIEQVKIKSDQTERVVSKTVKEYAFGDDLNRPGVRVLQDAGTQVPSSKPLGMIRQRAVRVETPGTSQIDVTPPYTTKTVTDVVNCKPFLVRVSDTVDNVPKSTNYGLFDAFTGNALATLNTGSAPTDTPRLNMTVPYRMQLDPSNPLQNTRLSQIVQKNLYSLAGGSFLSDNVNNHIIPNTISELMASHASDKNIRTAKCSMCKFDTIADWTGHYTGGNYSPFEFPQWRFTLNKEFTRKNKADDPFNWPNISLVDWVKDRTIDSTDRYCRPLIELNALGVPYTLIYHPLMNAITAKIDDAPKPTCAVYTCDYQDLESPSYFDSLNGWQKGQVFTGGVLEFVESPVHFGRKSLHVYNSEGPKIYLNQNYYSNTLDYWVSAWVYPKFSSAKIRFNCKYYFTYDNSLAKDNSKDISGFVQQQWQLVRIKIPKPPYPESEQYLEIAIGNNYNGGASPAPDFYIDDIRIYPVTAHVSTFYYDPDLQLPITFVDENNNAKYVKYDEFGRAVEKGVIK